MEAEIVLTKKKKVQLVIGLIPIFFCNISFTENWGYVYLKVSSNYLIMWTPSKFNMKH